MKSLTRSGALAAFIAIVLASEGLPLQAAQGSTGTVVGWELSPPGLPYSNAVPAGLEDVIAVAAGWTHSLALKKDGTVVAWGTRNYNVPMTVPGALNGVVAIAAGLDHDLAVQEDGTVAAWGDNTFG